MPKLDQPDPRWMKCGATNYLPTSATEITESGMYKICNSTYQMYLHILEVGETVTAATQYNAAVQMNGTYCPDEYIYLQQGQRIISNTTSGTYTRMIPV